MKKTALRFNPLKFARFIVILLTIIFIITLLSSCLKTKEGKTNILITPTPTVTVLATPTVTVKPTTTNITTPVILYKKRIEKELARKIVSRGGVDREYSVTQTVINKIRPIEMRATAYDLSVGSCGKSRNHKEYGITRTGTRATPKRTVAIDPNTIPLGSLLYIEFPEEENKRSGIYVAEDTGNKVIGDIIDIYLGEDEPGSNYVHKKCIEWGHKHVKVYVIKKGFDNK
jgi:3D (Asp-Asp-Asp) domain-containing protein